MLKRLILLFILIAAVVAFFAFDLDRFLSLKALQAQRSSLVDFRDAQPLLSSLAFFGIYVLATALSLPGAAILTLAGGAVFGLWWGVLIASFASTIGATGAFLVSRYLLRGTVQQRYGKRLKTINAGVERDGAPSAPGEIGRMRADDQRGTCSHFRSPWFEAAATGGVPCV